MKSTATAVSSALKDGFLIDCLCTNDILIDDVLRAAGELDRVGDGCTRRNYVRGVFAAMEGITYGMKRVVLRIAKEREFKLDAHDLGRLNETKLGAHGESQKFFLPFCDNVKFAFEMFAKIHRFTCRADFRCKGWAALLAAVEIRNRLMHPKSSIELEVGDNDLTEIREAADWYFPTYKLLMAQATRILPPIEPTKTTPQP